MDELRDHIVAALHELKALDVRALVVSDYTDLTEIMIFASGRSGRQVRALADKVIRTLREEMGVRPMGTEGLAEAEWILLDYNEVVTHIMLPSAREYYQLERLWEGPRPLPA